MHPEDIIQTLLTQRKVEDIPAFLHPASPLTFSLGALGFEKELTILLTQLNECKKNNANVVVYTDYDADGITGGAIMWETLHRLGFSVYPYVPHRQNEGYGFSIQGIEAVIQKYNPGLIISVDHGISAREQVQFARNKGIQVVITDHHAKPLLLPDSATAIIHCPLVSGSGLAYIAAHDIWKSVSPDNEALKELFTYDFLALASLGTIADLVPLTGFSRSIAKFGLAAFARAKKPGIRALMAISGLSDIDISAYHVGFALAPRINAVGRLSHAIEALRMLCTKDSDKAKRLAQEAQNHNSIRQKMVDVSVEEAYTIIEQKPVQNLILQRNAHWNEGIIGLISSKITERYQRPSIVMTKTKDGWKGSARSVKGFDVTAFLRSLKILEHVGGHPQAAGFSLANAQLKDFEKAVEIHMKHVPEPQMKKLSVDMDIPLNCISEALADRLKELAPFGIGNPTPVFQSKAKILFVKSMGSKQQHIKFVVQDPHKPTKQIEFVAFSPSDELRGHISAGATLSLIYTLESSYWQGRRQLKCFVKAASEVI